MDGWIGPDSNRDLCKNGWLSTEMVGAGLYARASAIQTDAEMQRREQNISFVIGRRGMISWLYREERRR